MTVEDQLLGKQVVQDLTAENQQLVGEGGEQVVLDVTAENQLCEAGVSGFDGTASPEKF